MTQPRITTPYGMRTDANDIIKDVNLDGKRALITGAASGIGIETARALALAGADVTIAVRNVEAGQKVAADLAAATGNPNIHVMALDLSDLASVEALARAWQGPLHILINNAGVMASPLSRSPQGWESQFATNHMGHFALALALHPAMKQEGARLVSLSSSGHHISPVVFEDIQYDIRPYDAWTAYGQSKSANALFAVEAARGKAAVHVVSTGEANPYRVKLRAPGFSNLSVFCDLARGTLLADAVSILGSLDLVIPEIDR